MRPWTVQLVAMLLLLAQTMFGMVGGKVMCIQMEHCDSLAHGGHGLHDHACSNLATFGERGFAARLEAVAEPTCDCHLHLAMPADDHVPSRPSVAVDAPASVSPSGLFASAATPGRASIRGCRHEPPRACWATTGLRSTRLMV